MARFFAIEGQADEGFSGHGAFLSWVLARGKTLAVRFVSGHSWGMAEKPQKSNDPFAVALRYARRGADVGEVPVGAVVVDGKTGEILARAHNLVKSRSDPTAHAEILAIQRAAKKLGSARLSGCDLYVTLEPCPMCATAISFARIRRLYFGASDPKGGGVEHGPRIFSQPTCHHSPEIMGGIRESESSELLKDFFKSRRG